MGNLGIDYGSLHEALVDARVGAKKKLESLSLRILKWLAMGIVLATMPVAVLIRGGVFAYREWAMGTWPAFGLAVIATALLLSLYAWGFSGKVGAGKSVRWIMTRGAALVALAYVGYGLVYVASANVKTPDVRDEYVALHPLLRIASSLLFLVDPASVITDAGRTEQDYFAIGLPVNEASLHFAQDDGFVHALDIRTTERHEWSNRAVELGFWALGFNSLRHVGTADHLHLSLRLPE